MNDDSLDAGDFGTWLDTMVEVLRGRGEADVACGDCTACCRSSQFIHIGPDEADALEHIPATLTFPAPGHPPGHVVLGYDDQGRCPMLGDSGCTIYAHRPRTCRVYDCRVFAATGVALTEPTRVAIADRVDRWRFTDGGERQDAVQAAARFLDRHGEAVLGTAVPNPVTVALGALEVFEAFLGEARPEPTDVAALLGER